MEAQPEIVIRVYYKFVLVHKCALIQVNDTIGEKQSDNSGRYLDPGALTSTPVKQTFTLPCRGSDQKDC